MILPLILALATPQLICTHEQTGERRPAQIIRLGGRERIAVEARQLGRIPKNRRASIILPDRQAIWSCVPTDGPEIPADPD